MCIFELNCVKKVGIEATHGEDIYDMGSACSRGEVVIPARTINDSRRIRIWLCKYLFAKITWT
jgi:hypothetical protein